MKYLIKLARELKRLKTPDVEENFIIGGSPGDVKWRAYDVGEAKEGLENELWRMRSNRRVGEWAVTWVKPRKDWRMSCDMGEATEGFENELWRR